ncbi:ribosome assembly factor SBDS [Candidatus Woesearchaeota archaeon]|nr:ribosome assembly factor SBDS [Candidatus Woesearchaeota archaeon]
MRREFTPGKERAHLNLARLKKGGEVFEIDVDPELAMKFKKGDASVDIHDVLKAERIFSDTQKGLVASSSTMKDLFGTDNVLDVARIIIQKGEIQLTSEYRQELRDAKKRRIISIIHTNGIDPRTKTPHPMQRIESALDEAKVKIDEYKTAEDQVNGIVEALRKILPISFSKKEIWLCVPASYAPKSQGMIRSMGRLLKEEWKNDGSWEVTIEIPGGLQEEFFDKLNSMTHGNVETKIVRE